MGENEQGGKFMQWLTKKGIVAETDDSENPGEWRQFEDIDWQAKKDAEGLGRLTADKPDEENIVNKPGETSSAQDSPKE